MASYYVINNVRLGVTLIKAGSLVTDGTDDTTAMAAAGALLWPSTDADVAAAALKAQDVFARGGDPREAESLMQAAVDLVQRDLSNTGAGKGASDVGVQDAAGRITAANVEAALAEFKALLDDKFTVRGVVFANVASLAAFTVAGNDGLTYVAGELVLLANQTTAAECGLYVVGTVGGGTAPLTRVTQYGAGIAIKCGMTVEVSEGTIFKGSTWKAMCTGAKVWGTDDPTFYPRVVKGTLTLASGTKTLGSAEGLFLLSTTTSPVTGGWNTAGGTVTSTVGWRAAVASRTAGKSGTAAVIVIAIVAAGTINAADNSTFDFCITNW